MWLHITESVILTNNLYYTFCKIFKIFFLLFGLFLLFLLLLMLLLQLLLLHLTFFSKLALMLLHCSCCSVYACVCVCVGNAMLSKAKYKDNNLLYDILCISLSLYHLFMMSFSLKKFCSKFKKKKVNKNTTL